MKTKNILLIGILVLLVGTVLVSASSTTHNYESAVTSRIVGNSIWELEDQLNMREMDLEDSLTSGGSSGAFGVYDILRALFGGHTQISIFNNIETELTGKNVLLLINPLNSVASMITAGNLNLNEIEDITDELDANDDLVLSDSPYSGLYIPHVESITATLSPHASYVAPMSYSSKGFVKAFLCNMGEYSTIGEVYRQARNNYYWNTDNKGELIGLTLMSYSLYGLPTREISVSGGSGSLSSYCKDYDEEFPKGSDFGTSSKVSADSTSSSKSFSAKSGGNTYAKEIEFVMEEHSLDVDGNFTLIRTNRTIDSFDLYELVLPRRVLVEEFPLRTMITRIEAVSLSDPVDFVVPDLPMYNGFEYVDRICYENEKDAGVKFSGAYTEDSRLVIASINPVEVVNCTEGRFRLYKKVNYEIDYTPFSSINIKEIDYVSGLLPRQEVNISVSLEDITGADLIGYLVIKDNNGKIVSGKEIDSSIENHEIPFTAPEVKGVYKYNLEFYYENESRTFREFEVEVNTIDLDLIVPEVVTTRADTVLVLESNFENSIDTEIEYYLINKGGVVFSDTMVVTLEPGINEFDLTFNNLKRNDIIYEILVAVPYNDDFETESANIIVEHAPVIIQGNIEMRENETLILNPDVYDIDGDSVSVSFGTPFVYDNTDGWTPSYDESGIYKIKIVADDGIKQIHRNISVTIENVNRAPYIGNLTKIFAKEGDISVFNPLIGDLDNENSVSNDDNNLTIYFSGLLNNTGEFVPDYDSSGSYNITIGVYDGEYDVQKEVEVEVINTNRAPVVVTQINVYENSTLNISDLVYDLDNNNSVDNDDNIVSLDYGSLFDSDGIWEISFDDSGNYHCNISVDDGEFFIKDKIRINVTNVNRVPVVLSEMREKYYISENSNISLDVSANDPDGDVVVVKWFVDSSEKGIGESFVFSSNGGTGTYNVEAVADDGDLSNNRGFEIVVSDVPVLDNFDGGTSLLNSGSLSSVNRFILERVGKGKITFLEPVDLSETVDFVNTVVLDNSYVSLNSNFLSVLEGVPAYVELYNVEFDDDNPVIYYEEGFGVGSTDNVCPTSICNNISYEGNTLRFNVAHFSTFLVGDGDRNHLDLNGMNNITIMALPSATQISESFEILNNGMADLDNLEIVGSFNEGFDIEVLPSSASLNSGDSMIISFEGSILLVPGIDSIYVGEIVLKDGSFEKSLSVFIEVYDALRLNDLMILGYGSTYDNPENGTSIKLASNKEFKIEFEVENLHGSGANIEIEDIEMEVLIKDIIGGDIMKDSRNFDLGPGEKNRGEILIQIPEIISNDYYLMHIKIVGWDGDKEYEINRFMTVKFIGLTGDNGAISVPLVVNDKILINGETIDSEKRSSEKLNFDKMILLFFIFDLVILSLIVIVLVYKSRQRIY